MLREKYMHSTTSRRPAPPFFFYNSDASQRACEAKGEKYVICHFGFFAHSVWYESNVCRDLAGTPVEIWNWHNLCIPSSSLYSHPNSLQFNNVTLHTARVNSSKFQGGKVFILNNHAHFSPRSPTSSLMLMPLQGRGCGWMCVFLSYFVQYTVHFKFSSFPSQWKAYIFLSSILPTVCYKILLSKLRGFEVLCGTSVNCLLSRPSWLNTKVIWIWL